MSDFVVNAPGMKLSVVEGSFNTRLAIPADVDVLVTVMAERDGTFADQVDRAGKMIERLDALLIEEKDGVRSAGAVLRNSQSTREPILSG